MDDADAIAQDVDGSWAVNVDSTTCRAHQHAALSPETSRRNIDEDRGFGDAPWPGTESDPEPEMWTRDGA
ncbi:hypothetical protein ABZV80_45870 [Streptomyces sp. NPDC005132]|uniref:hypothetical protein n=1 Tax=Streptomyces sp. NPDC005132 TaxID=3154294 RepID=UPI0033BCF9CE